MKTNICILSILIVLTSSCKKNTTGSTSDIITPQENDTLEVLFIGSSYFAYNNLIGLFSGLVENSSKSVIIGDQVTSGYLADHASRSSTEAKINEKDWDYVILQGVGRITAYPTIYTDHPVFPALETLKNKISNNCITTKMVFCMPRAYEDGMTWIPGWKDTYSDMQLEIYNNTLLWADSLGFIIAPVGWAWNTVLSEKNFPLHYLHMSDWNHPSLKGSYLMACTIYSTVYGKSAEGINYFGSLIETDAKYFQQVGSSTVLNDLARWNIN